MNCDYLPSTGLGADVGLVLLLAVACLVVGATMVLQARRGTRAASRAMVVILALGALTTFTALGTQSSAQAATPGCSASPSSDNRLTVTQTSTMVALAPDIAPAAITGRLVNISDESTHVTAVDVEIASITPHPQAPAGACTAADYRLLAGRMPVGRTLAPGGSTSFVGASIGFDTSTSNQDACQGATIHLRYTANPK